ncbi:hypothetical protein BBJ28_00002257 [Nothophytophthora sp. Chile5]|nr:hypothetical protein BBJ28_00002257 [Nothophytophthora sp. Chile5]
MGTVNGIMKAFDDIAEQCRRDPSFHVTKTGPPLRTRCMTLTTQFNSDQCESMRQSGTLEEYEQRKKVTKREQLKVVTSALADAISSIEDEVKGKYGYNLNRLEFECEQAEKQCQHDEAEADKRRAHELEMEQRRLKAEEVREKMMHDCLLKMIEQQKH